MYYIWAAVQGTGRHTRAGRDRDGQLCLGYVCHIWPAVHRSGAQGLAMPGMASCAKVGQFCKGQVWKGWHCKGWMCLDKTVVQGLNVPGLGSCARGVCSTSGQLCKGWVVTQVLDVPGIGICASTRCASARCAVTRHARASGSDDPLCKSWIVVQGLDSHPKVRHACQSFKGWTALQRQDGRGLIQSCKGWMWKGITHSCAHIPSPVQE